MAIQDFKAGDILLNEGEVPTRAYRIVEGSVELARADGGLSAPIAILDRGALVGAEELIDGQAMSQTAQALGALKAEPIVKEQAERLLGRKSKTAKPEKRAARTRTANPDSRALVALSAQADTPYVAADSVASVLKPGLLARILKPDFVDLHDRIDVRVSPLLGEPTDQPALHHLVSELNQRRGLRAKAMPTRVMLDAGGDPVAGMEDLRCAVARWLVDNGGDAVVWGALAPSGDAMHIRLFIRDDKPVDRFRLGDGWSMLALPYPLDDAGAHRLHAAILAAIRTKAAGKELTVRRDLEVLMADARDQLMSEVPGLGPFERAEDRAAQARVIANVLRFKRRADDAKTAMALIDMALSVFSAEETPIEWALAHRDRAFLGQFIAERTNDTDALRGSMQDVKQALRVFRAALFPNDWAMLNDRLGLALYRLDSNGDDIAILERAMKAFENALSVYDKKQSPTEWADAMGHFGQVALVVGRERRSSLVLLRAVEACNAVLTVRDRRHSPLHWAAAQNNLGSALFLYGRVADDTDALRGAADAFQTAHAIYVEKGSDRLAAVAAKNQRHVDAALARSAGRARTAEGNLRSNNDEPPPLPWEYEDDRDDFSVTPSRKRPGMTGRNDNWLDDRLR